MNEIITQQELSLDSKKEIKWNQDIFFLIALTMDVDCCVLELVCKKYRDFMSKREFWAQLLTTRENNKEEKEDGKNNNEEKLFILNKEQISVARTIFFVGSSFHWDVDMIKNAITPSISISNNDLTLEPSIDRIWRTLKTKESFPQKEGSYFCFCLDVDRCTTEVEFIGFGISPLLLSQNDDELDPYRHGRCPHETPWMWLNPTNLWKTGDQVGIIGRIRNGYYEHKFWKNDKIDNSTSEHDFTFEKESHNNQNYRDVYLKKSHVMFPHFSIALPEKFTISKPRLPLIHYIRMLDSC
jgi:hypothetical protein